MSTWTKTCSGSTYLHLKLTVTQKSQNVANNTSTLSYTLQVYKDSSSTAASYNNGGFGYSVTINGTKIVNKSGQSCTVNPGKTITLASGTTTVTHNTDGTKSVACKASFTGSPFTASCSGTLTLTTIKRVSSVALSSSSIEAGKSVNVNITRYNSSFKHNLTYTFGNTSDTIVSGTTSTSVAWTVPPTLLNQIPSATSGWGTITCTTLNGSTSLGTSTVKFTVTAGSGIKPTISSVGVTVDNSANAKVKEWGLYVAGYSKAKITASVTLAYSSAIKSFAIGGDYTATVTSSSLSYTGTTLTSAGNKTFSVTATDNRGRTSDKKTSSTINVVAYSKPTISSFSVYRSSSDNNKLVVRANWDYASVSGKNSVAVTLKYKPSSSSGWTTYSGSITKGSDTELSDTFSSTSSYNLKLSVQDALGNTVETEAYIPTMSVLLDFKAGGKGLGIGKIAETDALEVALDSYFSGPLYLSGKNYLYINNYAVVDYGDGSNVVFGRGALGNSKNSYLMGKSVHIRVGSTNDYADFTPYFTAGDSFTADYSTGGYLTSSGTQVRFLLPLSKPAIKCSGVTVTVSKGFVLRQGGKYTHGSNWNGANVYATASSISAKLLGGGNAVQITATFTNTTNAINNDSIGIEVAELTVKFT